MPTVLDQMPFLEIAGEVVVRGERVRVRANQIILWVSLTRRSVRAPNPSAIPFPVILDTGHTHSLSLQERHLVAWAGLRPESLSELGQIRERNVRVPLRAANIWIHANDQRKSRKSGGSATPSDRCRPRDRCLSGRRLPKAPDSGAAGDCGEQLGADGGREAAVGHAPSGDPMVAVRVIQAD